MTINSYQSSTGTAGFPARNRRLERDPVSGLPLDRPKVKRVRFVHCCVPGCHREDEIFDNGTVELPPDVVKRKFLQTHWEIGKNRSHDICPDCANSKQRKVPATMEEMKVVLKPVLVPDKKLEAPAEMTTEERRIIFAKLSEVWAGENEGYVTPWTDISVAKDLGVPHGWVANVRSQFFGEVSDNSEIRSLLERAAKVNEEIARKLVEANTIANQLSGMVAKVNALNGEMKELRNSAEGLAVIADRIGKALR